MGLLAMAKVDRRVGHNMAIAFDAAATSTDQTASPITWNHTCASSTNTMLIVGLGLANATGNVITATSVTYNGIPMTKYRGDQVTASNSQLESSIWMLANPPAGTFTVSVAFSAGTIPHGSGVSVSYTGVKQMSLADTGNGTTGTTTGDKTMSVTTQVDNSWVFAVGINAASSGGTLAADQTSRGTQTMSSTINSIIRAEDTNGPITPAGATTVGMTVGASAGESDFVISAAVFSPKQIAGFTQNKLRPRAFAPGIAR
jgi:hypothetical protein